MTTINLEIFLGNLSFVLLFLLMIFYWVEAIFSIIPKFNVIIFLFTLIANFSLFIILIFRWLTYGYFPLSNLYESLLFLSWSFTFIELIFIAPLVQFKLKFLFNTLNFSFPFFPNTNFNFYTKIPKKQFLNLNINILIGTIFSPIALFTHSFAIFSLPKSLQKAQALVPALQSNWLMMHVTVMLLSYTALLCGSLLSIAFLVITWYQSQVSSNTNFLNKSPFPQQPLVEPAGYKGFSRPDTSLSVSNSSSKNSNYTTNKLFSKKYIIPSSSTLPNSISLNTQVEQKNEKASSILALPGSNIASSPIAKIAQTLDNLSYRIIGMGFPLLTIGILSGAVWANEAWGSYWSWDPKETWAFITWLIFAIYLHTRITQGWNGKKSAILASFGFFIIWICYLGVNLVGKGLHSYGWIQLS
jgi:cytochrome c-type biogenesis protein CcsB